MGKIQIFCGNGKGKSSAAVGSSIRYINEGKEAIIVQFLKGKIESDKNILERLEPELKIFSFETGQGNYCDLSEDNKAEQLQNIRNGLNYAKKVIDTGECDLLVLDEALGLIDYNIISIEDIIEILETADDIDIILTGRYLPREIRKYADEVFQIVEIVE